MVGKTGIAITTRAARELPVWATVDFKRFARDVRSGDILESLRKPLTKEAVTAVLSDDFILLESDSVEEENLRLVRLAPADLGFTTLVSFMTCATGAHAVGLRMCPYATALAFYMQHDGVFDSKGVYFASRPVGFKKHILCRVGYKGVQLLDARPLGGKGTPESSGLLSPKDYLVFLAPR